MLKNPSIRRLRNAQARQCAAGAYPDVKFHVTCGPGGWPKVSWTDGPTENAAYEAFREQARARGMTPGAVRTERTESVLFKIAACLHDRAGEGDYFRRNDIPGDPVGSWSSVYVQRNLDARDITDDEWHRAEILLQIGWEQPPMPWVEFHELAEKVFDLAATVDGLCAPV